MMTTTLETPQSMKSREPLEKVFNVLFTPTMYTEIAHHSNHLNISKGNLIRFAIEEYLQKLQDQESMAYAQQMDYQNSCERENPGVL